jgi:hypothetical protein
LLVVVLYLGFACHCSSSVAPSTTSSFCSATTSFEDCTRHQCPCAVRLLTFFANGDYKLD